MSTLSFYGAAGMVTGSCSLLCTGSARILMDCGMFQGNRSVRALNEQPFPFKAADIDVMLLTHAHTDHTGLIPKLVKDGFGGEIHATPPTIDLLAFMMRDSAKIQEMEWERQSRRNRRQGGNDDGEPLYTMEHAEEALERLRPVEYGEWIEPVRGTHARYWNAGHILGSASIELRYPDDRSDHTMRLLFSGDLGPDEKSFYKEPDAEQGFDYVICESTYGDRDREDYSLKGRRTVLLRELTDGLARGGNVVIPCFAVERSQELLHDIGVLLAEGELPDAHIFLDSPLASRVTRVFIKHAGQLKDVSLPKDKLFRHPCFHLIEDIEDSKAINRVKGGAIIISASGMADAGRIVHHLRANIWREEATVLFVGYQAPGTTGAHILGGADNVRLHGREFKIRAAIRRLGNYSAHADQPELINWISERMPIAGGLFLNHGDEDAREELARLLDARGLPLETIYLPQFDQTYQLTAQGPETKGRQKKPRITPDEMAEDWHERYGRLLAEIDRAVQTARTPRAREALLARLRETLGP